MKLCIFTIVLDGMPFIAWQYERFEKLTCDWRWIVVEGAAQNQGSTRWCKPQEKRHSNDATVEYVKSLNDPRVRLVGSADWPSKDGMVQAAIMQIDKSEPCVLMQIDVDEIHKPESIDSIVKLFENDSQLVSIRLPCRYFVGPKLVCEGENCWSNWNKEYDRVWRFEPGMTFLSHEPPLLNNALSGFRMPRDMSGKLGLRFDHLAYVREEQVAYKEQFYGYTDLLNQWRALQRNTVWPAKLSRFFSFVSGELPIVRKI